MKLTEHCTGCGTKTDKWAMPDDGEVVCLECYTDTLADQVDIDVPEEHYGEAVRMLLGKLRRA